MSSEDNVFADEYSYESLISYDDGAKFFEAVLGGLSRQEDNDETDYTFEIDSNNESSSYFTDEEDQQDNPNEGYFESDNSSYFVNEEEDQSDLIEEASPFVEEISDNDKKNLADLGKNIIKALNSL